MTKNLYVGNLSYKTTADALRTLFAEFGEVESVNLITDRDTGRSKGFGFVEMSTAAEAQKAINMFHDFEMDNRALVVNVARPREERGGGGDSRNRRGPGGGGGRGGQGGFGGSRRF
jgi:RNA recognition motif-containing protein